MAGDWIDELVDASLKQGNWSRDEDGEPQYAVTPRRMIEVIPADPYGDHLNCQICHGRRKLR